MTGKKKFNNLNWCEKHRKYYHWYYKCSDCKREKKPVMKRINQVIKEMQDCGELPGSNDDKNNNTDN